MFCVVFWTEYISLVSSHPHQVFYLRAFLRLVQGEEELIRERPGVSYLVACSAVMYVLCWRRCTYAPKAEADTDLRGPRKYRPIWRFAGRLKSILGRLSVAIPTSLRIGIRYRYPIRSLPPHRPQPEVRIFSRCGWVGSLLVMWEKFMFVQLR